MSRRQLTLFTLALAVMALSGGSAREPATPVPDVALAAPNAAVDATREFFERRATGLLRAEIAELAPVIVAEARRVGLEPDVVLAVIQVESSGNNFAMSPAGALGLMQVLPSTGAAEAARLGIPWRGDKTLFDPVVNVRLGINYLDRLVTRFGDLPTALAAYNWGPSRIAQRMQRGDAMPVTYSQRVLSAYDVLVARGRA